MNSEMTALAPLLFSHIILTVNKMQNEIWKIIPNYGELYQISNLGRVKRIRSSVNCRCNCKRIVSERILKGHVNKMGYRTVSLSYLCKIKTILVYKLVATSFLDMSNYKKGMTIDHINHNTKDDRQINLQIITHRENLSKDKFRKGKSSKYVGVSFIKSRSKWYASIRINGKSKSLGLYDNELDANLAYKNALNFLSD